jgi:hypothetical protein
VVVVDADHLVELVVGLNPHAVALAEGGVGKAAGKAGHERLMKGFMKRKDGMGDRPGWLCPSDRGVGGAARLEKPRLKDSF